jgi:hypothetical membrane protein
MSGRKTAVIIVVIAAIIASVLTYPIAEGFMIAENALSGRYGNAGYGKFNQEYAGGWIVNGYPGLPKIQHRAEMDG